MNENYEYFIVKLNDNEYLPKMAYRRNVRVYELVCYVNNIVACLHSKNWKAIKLFMERSRQFLSENQPTHTDQRYYELVSSFLEALEADLEY